MTSPDLDHPAWAQLPRPTAHPLQRLGAFALAALGGRRRPDELDVPGFHAAVQTMTDHLVATAPLSKHDKGSFWLSSGNWLWPNAPGIHPRRSQHGVDELATRIRTWRTPAAPEQWPELPCRLCHRHAVHCVGKMDIPLGASTEYLNTTAPGVAGWPLCWGCLTSLWAAPYGSWLQGGFATSLISSDDEIMASFTPKQVRRTRQVAHAGQATAVQGKYLAAQLAVQYIRSLRASEIHAEVTLLVWKNDNKRPVYEAHPFSNDLVAWLHSTVTDPERRAGWADLCAVFHSSNVTGFAALAHTVATEPTDVPNRVVRRLLRHCSTHGAVPSALPRLLPLLTSYTTEVLHMPTPARDDILALAQRVADLLVDDKARGTASPLKNFLTHTNRTSGLKSWLMTHGISWNQRNPTSGPLFTTRQFELLFSPDEDQAWWWRQLTRAAVLAELGARNYAPTEDDLLDEQALQEANFDEEPNELVAEAPEPQ